jgi:hypothetical protein
MTANHALRAWTHVDHRGREAQLVVPVSNRSPWAACLVAKPQNAATGEHVYLSHSELADLHRVIEEQLARSVHPDVLPEATVTAVEG